MRVTVQIWHHTIPATAFLVRSIMYHVTCTCMECMVWLPHEILYQLQQCYSTIDGWYRTMQKYWSTSSMQCIIYNYVGNWRGHLISFTMMGWHTKMRWFDWPLVSSNVWGDLEMHVWSGQKGHHLAILTYVWGNCGHENENRGVAKNLHLEISTEPHCRTFLEWVYAVTMVQYKKSRLLVNC